MLQEGAVANLERTAVGLAQIVITEGNAASKK